MKKTWKIFGSIALICLILGIALIGAGFFAGGSPVSIEKHGNLAEYTARLQMNWEILGQQFQSFLANLGF